MASPPGVGLTVHERLRRNEVILTSVRRKADELSAAIKSPAVRRRSILLSQPPPDPQPAPPNPTPSRLRAPKKPTPYERPDLPKPTPSRRRAPTPTPDEPRSTAFSSSLASTILETISLSPGAAKIRADDFVARKELVLAPANVRKLLTNRIMVLLVLPLVDRTVVAAGNNLGNLGFWHADGEPGVPEADGVFEYLPHKGPVTAIVAHLAVPHKIYSCSREVEICLMDLHKDNFNIVHSCDYPLYTLCQAPDSASCLYFGGVNGKLKLFDDRMDFHLEKKHMLATSSTDKTTRIWDLRRLTEKKEDCLTVLQHDASVQSAYFSPSGRMLATTCLDDTVRVFEEDDFNSSHTIKHNNQTGRWICTFKAIWGWTDTDLFIGNMNRAIDIISVGSSSDGGGLLLASNSVCLESKHMTTIPCRFSAHPYRVGHLACASTGGVFLRTRA